MTYIAPVSNPFDPAVPDFDAQTLPLDEVIRQAIGAALLRVRVCLPASITEVNENQNVDVQPLLQTRYQDGRVVNLPIIRQVPVSMPMGQDYSIKVPLAVGDTGYLIFCDRSLEAWSASDGGIVDPADSRSHDLTDAIFVPGLVPFGSQTEDETTDLVITNGKAIIRVQKGGTFELKNSSNELLDLLCQITSQCQELSNTLSTDTVNTAIGPMQLNAFSQYASIASQLETLLTKLETLKGS